MAASMAAALCLFTPAQAQFGRWGNGWGDNYGTSMPPRQMRDPREGRVEVSRFVTAGAANGSLGHGDIDVTSQAGDGPWLDQSDRAAYEAAVVDALIGAGYDTRHASDAQGQMATLRISRQVLVPAEEKRNPVSGSAAMSVGTRGSAYGLALNVDMTKPKSALISTRLDTRITDKASGKVLWEGYATIATREGADDWTESKIAGKLAAALFDNFPMSATTVPEGAPQS